MSDLIGITGASGGIGQRVAARLAQQGVPLRLVVRDLSRAPQFPNAEIRQASDYGDLPAMIAALQGIDTLFFIPGDLGADRVQKHASAIDAGIAAGAKRIVYLSFFGASPGATFIAAREHYHTEQHIRSLGVPYTFLRANLYADFVPEFFGEDRVVRGPAASGRAAFVTRDDIAAVAAAVLTSADSEHDGQIYDITGLESLSLYDVSAIMTEVTRLPFRYHEETLEEAIESRRIYNVDDAIIATWISTYTALAAGELDVVTDTVSRITGEIPRTLQQFLTENPDSWAKFAE